MNAPERTMTPQEAALLTQERRAACLRMERQYAQWRHGDGAWPAEWGPRVWGEEQAQERQLTMDFEGA